MRIDVLTLFPEMFEAPLKSSIVGRAIKQGYLDVGIVNYRDFAMNRHKTVDDTPFGGGAGMVLKPEPIFLAVESLRAKMTSSLTSTVSPKVILLSPQGRVFSQRVAEELASMDHIIFISGHYEGFDERIREHLVDDELSIGDYVLTGGELPALVVIDAVARLLPGVLGNEQSAVDDSFSQGLLEFPQYTKPSEFRGFKVPDVLLSGHHANIATWRRQQSLLVTWRKRPELLQFVPLDRQDKVFLETFGWKDNDSEPTD